MDFAGALDSLPPHGMVHGFSRPEYWSRYHVLLQDFLTEGSNTDLPHCRWILYHLSHQGSPLGSPVVKILCFHCRGRGVSPWLGKTPWREMATHSSFLAWRNPWTEEPGGLQSMESQIDAHN